MSLLVEKNSITRNSYLFLYYFFILFNTIIGGMKMKNEDNNIKVLDEANKGCCMGCAYVDSLIDGFKELMK